MLRRNVGTLEIDRMHRMRDAGSGPLGLRLNENLARDDGIKEPCLGSSSFLSKYILCFEP